MTLFPFRNPLQRVNDELKKEKYNTNNNVTFSAGSTAVSASTAYKTKIANKYHSIETTDVKVYKQNQTPTYEDMCLILFAIKKIGKTESSEPIICTYDNNAEIKLSGKLSEFLKQIQTTNNMYVKVWIGNKKTPFCFLVSNGDDRIQVTTRIYHPKEISSRNILDLLQLKINKQLRYLYAMRNKIFILSNLNTVKNTNNITPNFIKK